MQTGTAPGFTSALSLALFAATSVLACETAVDSPACEVAAKTATLDQAVLDAATARIPGVQVTSTPCGAVSLSKPSGFVDARYPLRTPFHLRYEKAGYVPALSEELRVDATGYVGALLLPVHLYTPEQVAVPLPGYAADQAQLLAFVTVPPECAQVDLAAMAWTLDGHPEAQVHVTGSLVAFEHVAPGPPTTLHAQPGACGVAMVGARAAAAWRPTGRMALEAGAVTQVAVELEPMP